MESALAVAVAKTAIGKLSDSVWKELSSIWGLEKECEEMKNLFAIVSTVLEDADNKARKNKLVQMWLSRLQEVAYDVEDLLDDFQIHATKKNAIKPTTLALGKVQRFFTSRNKIGFRYSMAKRIQEINERMLKITEEKRNFQLLQSDFVVAAEPTATAEKEGTLSVVNESQIYGRDEDKKHLIYFLLHRENEKKLSSICLTGIGGVGKATLVQLVCNSPEIKSYFQPIIWVKVCDFNFYEILRRMCECVSGEACHLSSVEAMAKKLRSKISGTRFLVVLNDIWNTYQGYWHSLEAILNCGMLGSKMILTARHNEVARINNSFAIYRVNSLGFEHCWNLFKERAFQNLSEREIANLTKIGKDIVNKCGGFPLAAKQLGSLVGSTKEREDWCAIRDSEIWQIAECSDSILSPLLVSYFYLPSHSKRCFAYCSLFPMGFGFRVEYLIQLWISEGFVHSESTAIQCFNDLVSRSFFQKDEFKHRIPDTSSVVYKMHDLIHCLARYVAGDKLFLRSENHSKENNKWRYSSVAPDAITEPGKLRTILYGSAVSGLKDVNLDPILNQKYLRVLDLSFCKIKNLPKNIGNLMHLRYLNLRGNHIKTLPKSIIKLHNLEVLYLCYCKWLSKLPYGIGSINNLRVLDLKHCDSLVSIPKGIGKLTKLVRFPYFVIGSEGCSIGELQHLNLLKDDLEIFVLPEMHGLQDADHANLDAKQHLKSLKLLIKERQHQDKDVEVILPIGILQPPPQLEVLHISCHRHGFELPFWMTSTDFLIGYSNLVDIRLRYVKECECFPQFGQLPWLKILHLILCFSITKVKTQFSGSNGIFPMLEDLSLSSEENGSVVPEETVVEADRMTQNMFPCLKKMILRCPFGILWPCIPQTVEQLQIKLHYKQQFLLERCLQSSSQLKNLSLSGIESDSFDGIKYLNVLEDLEIANSKWEYFPDAILQHHLPSLKRLAVGFMSKLLTLDLSPGPQPPPLFATLKHLSIESCNLLIGFPGWFECLHSLQSLDLANLEKLRSLRESIGNLISLQSLSLHDCPNLTDFPQDIGKLTSLQRLTIVNCPGLSEYCHKISHIHYVNMCPAAKGISQDELIAECSYHVEKKRT